MQTAGSPRKKLVSGWVWVVLGLVAVWVAAAIIVESGKSPARSVAGAVERLGPGDWGRLESGEEADVALAVDLAALKAMTDAKANDDNLGYLEVLVTRRAFPVPKGTRVKITEAGETAFKVQVMEGELKGYAGWVAVECVKQIPN